MKKLYVTLFSALFLGGAICASCTDKKDASAEEVINTIHKVNNYWQTNHPEHGRSFWDNAAYHTGNMEAYFLTKQPEYLNTRKPGRNIMNGKGQNQIIRKTGSTVTVKVMIMCFSVTIRFVFRRMPISIIWNRIHRK